MNQEDGESSSPPGEPVDAPGFAAPGFAAPGDAASPSALAAIGVVALVALLVAGSIVTWARLAGPATATPSPVTLQEERPTSLPDGRDFADVAPEIEAAVEGPVVGAVRLERPPPGLENCGRDGGEFDEEPSFESGFVTPEAAVVSVVGSSEDWGFLETEDGELVSMQVRAVCEGAWDGGWHEGSSFTGPVDDMFMGGGYSCCDRDGMATATATVAIPDGVAWLVQDRGGYRLAYEVADLPALTLTWRFREGVFGVPPRSLVTMLDDQGGVLEERFVGN